MPKRPLIATTAACVLTLAACSCSRQSSEPQSEAPLTPAAGEPAPEPRPISRCAANFAGFDDDRDGRVSAQEFMARPHSRGNAMDVFRSRDRDGDGSLVEAEFCAGWRGTPREGAPHRGGPRRGFMTPGHGAGPMGKATCDQHFSMFDADRDGKLTLGEFSAWPHARGEAAALFEERDRDRDGIVTQDEFCSAWVGAGGPMPMPK